MYDVSVYRKIESNPDQATIAQAKKFCKAAAIPMDELCFLPETLIKMDILIRANTQNFVNDTL